MNTNRITPYERGWLGLLVEQGICTSDEAREAMLRVAQAAIDALEERRAAEKYVKRGRRRRRPE